MLIHWIHTLTVGNLITNSFSIAEMLLSPFHIHVNFIQSNILPVTSKWKFKQRKSTRLMFHLQSLLLPHMIWVMNQMNGH